jgi:uncharacterized membrane protein
MDQENQTAEQTVPSNETASAEQKTTTAVDDHKLFAIVGYILPFLFFVPMVQESSKNNAFARYHANQQLTLLVLCIGLYVLMQVIYSISYMLMMFIPLLNLGLLVLAIMGIIHAAQGEMKELPLVGKFNFLDMVFHK